MIHQFILSKHQSIYCIPFTAIIFGPGKTNRFGVPSRCETAIQKVIDFPAWFRGKAQRQMQPMEADSSVAEEMEQWQATMVG